jgi:hypothetical protein
MFHKTVISGEPCFKRQNKYGFIILFIQQTYIYYYINHNNHSNLIINNSYA